MAGREGGVSLGNEMERDRGTAAADNRLSDGGADSAGAERKPGRDREKEPLTASPQHDRRDDSDECGYRGTSNLAQHARQRDDVVRAMFGEPSQVERVGGKSPLCRVTSSVTPPNTTIVAPNTASPAANAKVAATERPSRARKRAIATRDRRRPADRIGRF